MSVSTTPGPHYIKNSKRIIWIYLLLFVCSIGLLWWLWHLFGWWLIGIILLYLLGKQRNKISISQWFNQTISWIKSKGQAGPRLTTIFGIALIVFAVWFARYTYEDWQAKRAFRHEQEDRRVVCISKDNSISAIELAKISDLPVGKVTLNGTYKYTRGKAYYFTPLSDSICKLHFMMAADTTKYCVVEARRSGNDLYSPVIEGKALTEQGTCLVRPETPMKMLVESD